MAFDNKKRFQCIASTVDGHRLNIASENLLFFFSLGKIFDSISVDAGIQGNWIVFRLFVEVVAIEKVAVNIDIEIHVPIAVLMAGERLRHHASRK